MPTSLVSTALRAMGQCPTEMDIHETIIKVYLLSNIMIRMKYMPNNSILCQKCEINFMLIGG